MEEAEKTNEMVRQFWNRQQQEAATTGSLERQKEELVQPEPRQKALDGSHNQSKPDWWELGPGRSHGEDTTQAGKEREQKYLRFFSLSPTFQLPARMQPTGVSPLPPRTEQGQSKWSNIP